MSFTSTWLIATIDSACEFHKQARIVIYNYRRFLTLHRLADLMFACAHPATGVARALKSSLQPSVGEMHLSIVFWSHPHHSKGVQRSRIVGKLPFTQLVPTNPKQYWHLAWLMIFALLAAPYCSVACVLYGLAFFDASSYALFCPCYLLSVICHISVK